MTSQYVHPEWDKNTSLTAPEDRDPTKTLQPERNAPPLSDAETNEATNALSNRTFVKKFPRTERTVRDPPVPMQHIGLISFTPAKGATPNAKGVFGFAKLRGNYATEAEAEQRAQFILRNLDSYHEIYHALVGFPFPITQKPSYAAETEEVDIRRQMVQETSNHIKQKKLDEEKTMQDMKDKETTMLEESKRARDDDGLGDPYVDPYEQYITLCVKKAQLSWTFLEHLKKLREVRDIIVKTRAELVELDENHPEFRNRYFEKYMEARHNAGLDEQVRDVQDNFIKYMVEEARIPTIDTNEVLPKVPGQEDLNETKEDLSPEYLDQPNPMEV